MTGVIREGDEAYSRRSRATGWTNVSLDLSTIYFIFLILMGVELPFCIVVIVVTLSQNDIICFLELS